MDEIAEDHVHVFLSFPARYNISWLISREHPEVERDF
jgi:hypothetical protein